MKKLLPILITGLIYFFFVSPFSFAQINPDPTAPVDVKASVGDFYLNISGYIAPYASIVLTADGVFLRSTVADSKGYFYISSILMKRESKEICLDAIDFKRIGESFTCFKVPLSGRMDNIFLPPTLGLSKTEIGEGENVIAAGYSMPHALVKLHFNGKVLTVFADETGYYEFKLDNIKAGKYELYATAEYDNKESLEPTKKTQLRALTWWEQFVAYIKETIGKIYRFLTSLSLGPLWLGIPLLIAIVMLILKIWPERFTFIYNSRFLAWLPKGKNKKKLHHSWFIGY